MMAVLIMATVGFDYVKAGALWGRTQRRLLHGTVMLVPKAKRLASYAVGLRGPQDVRERNILKVSAKQLRINPVLVWGMGPGATVEIVKIFSCTRRER
jgi:hypothetical protein